MIYKAKHNFFLYPFFQFYSIWKIKLNFHKVHICGEFRDRGLPVFLVANHISWWDGFWIVWLNRRLFRRKYFYFMMLEEELKNRMFLNKAGGYSVKKGSRSVIETIDYTAQLLDDKNNLVLIFPQGEIKSIYLREIKFEKGLEYILKRSSGNFQMVFIAFLIDYFSEKKPSLYIYLKEYDFQVSDVKTIESDYNIFYNYCMSENIRKASE
jgi:1-acyl-sn-glycerol-3-phosphate acyltransferase